MGDASGTPRVVYYESIKRELKIRGIYECRCDERLQTKKIKCCLLLIDKARGKVKKRRLFIYYESTKRKLKTKYICGCRCYERLQPNTKEFTRLSYTEG